jgi:hypothetical protein
MHSLLVCYIFNFFIAVEIFSHHHQHIILLIVQNVKISIHPFRFEKREPETKLGYIVPRYVKENISHNNQMMHQPILLLERDALILRIYAYILQY